MSDTTCPTCGSAVRISTSDEGTSCYLPVTDTAALNRAMGALRRAAQKGGCEQRDLAAWETVNAAINRLELEQLIERAAIQRVIEAWEEAGQMALRIVSGELAEAIEGMRPGDEVMA